MRFGKMHDGGTRSMGQEGRESPEESCWTEECSEEEEEWDYISEEERSHGSQQPLGRDSWLPGVGRLHTSLQWPEGFKGPRGSQLGSHPRLFPLDCFEGRATSPLHEVLQPRLRLGGTHAEAHLACTVPPTVYCTSKKDMGTGRKPKASALDCWQAKAPSPGIGGLFSSRILSHPSFISYYTAVAILQRSQGPFESTYEAPAANVDHANQGPVGEDIYGANIVTAAGDSAYVLPINHSDFFYTDPLMAPGHRIYNCLSPQSQQVFRCFHLNTPPPIMSFCEQSAPRRPPSCIDFPFFCRAKNIWHRCCLHQVALCG
ncbi:uncharacterized protein LOC115078640 [Rhinatrema bivittatum]|uniref:uncharacterized protein LOC115078640 n=1 Tax=Rhinatrema bivittatum TaxID=194408 RepID=UPI0011294FC4|nr:uncharacterized protein LOC115078640 [Rhinatrema bivittatum]